MSKPYAITCSELDRQFHVYTESKQFVALAPTAKAHSSANWDNKKITPKALWESVSTEPERLAIAAVLEEPGITKDAVKSKLEALQAEFTVNAKPGRKRQKPDEAEGPTI